MCAENMVGATCGRLLVLVQKGKRFINSGKTYSFSIFISVHTFSRARAWLSLTVVQGHEIIGAAFKKFRRQKGISY